MCMCYFVQPSPYKIENANLAASILADGAERAERYAADHPPAVAAAMRVEARSLRAAAKEVLRLRADRGRALRVLETRPWGAASAAVAKLLDGEPGEYWNGRDGVAVSATSALLRGECY